MRKISRLKNTSSSTVRLMIYSDGVGTYLFGYHSLNDCSSDWDEWYETEQEADEICEAKFGVSRNDWNIIPDPEAFCQHDWIKPVRVKGREKGKLEFGKLEEFVNGKWTDINSNGSPD